MTGPVVDSALTRWCGESLGAEPVKQLFSREATSSILGLRLADGRQVVVKARSDAVARVSACLRLQSALFAARYPCPRPLTDAEIVGGLTVHAEEYVDGGAQMFGEDGVLAPPFATAYAELMDRLSRLHEVVVPDVLVPGIWISWWSQRPWSRQSQVPSFLYDVAQRVRERMASVYLPGVIGHADWESQNLRWAHGRVVAVHDWDSLAWAPEAVLVGGAAAAFPGADQPETASIAATATFLEHYQLARGREFTADELEVAWAAGLLPSLHNARNEALESRRPLILARLADDYAERLALAGA